MARSGSAEPAVSRTGKSSHLKGIAGEKVRGGGGALEFSPALDGEERGGRGRPDADVAGRLGDKQVVRVDGKVAGGGQIGGGAIEGDVGVGDGNGGRINI